MKLTELFTKTEKRGEEGANKGLSFLERGGFIKKIGGGIYTFLPLGLLVLERIEDIISAEMEKLGAQRILMPALSPKLNWERTGRWDKFDTLFKLKGRGGQEYALCPTHEEIVVPVVKSFNLSYRDLPFSVYQIQTKFRDEKRVKSGLFRTKEFIMKDLYSFHGEEKDLERFHDKVINSYFRIFRKIGLGRETYLTLARGGTFSKYSFEFQTLSEWGEDRIFICKRCKTALNKELVKSERDKRCFKCKGKLTEERKAIEVANVFKLGDKFSKAFGLKFRDRAGKEKFVLMGCYGIGITRLMGAIADVHHDQHGLIWPETVSPFEIHLVSLEKDKKVKKFSEEIYSILQRMGKKVLYDDRDSKSPAEKLIDADLIGIPWRMVVSKKTVSRRKVELRRRGRKRVNLISKKEMIKFFEK